MIEHKIVLFVLSVIVYSIYSFQVWLSKDSVNDVNIEIPKLDIAIKSEPQVNNNDIQANRIKKPKNIPLNFKNTCNILEVFTVKPNTKPKQVKADEMEANAVTVIGITVFLVILALNAVLDVLKVKEEERARKKLNPNGERRKSLSEFAKKKSLRRESSKFGLQLFQIAESFVSTNEDKTSRRETRPYTRGESTNSYLSDKKSQSEGSTSASINEGLSTESRLLKRQSITKLFGTRPVPMVRRSSFPALPLNPDVQALMLGHRQASYDSDDEGDGKGRRVRLIRRY